MKKQIILATAFAAAAVSVGATYMRWGYDGHEMTGYAAAVSVPKDMPEFFRESVAQLTYLNPEPDRWRAPDSSRHRSSSSFSPGTNTCWRRR